MTASVNTLLQTLDGVSDTAPHVITIAATNYPWLLDSAVMRRLKVRVMVDLPGLDSRYNMLYSTFRDRVLQKPQRLVYLEKRWAEQQIIDKENAQYELERISQARARGIPASELPKVTQEIKLINDEGLKDMKELQQALEKDTLRFDANPDFQKMFAKIAHLTGWIDTLEGTATIQTFFELQINNADTYRDDITKFVNEGDHVTASMVGSVWNDVFKKDTKAYRGTITKPNDVLSTPRYKFGFTSDDVIKLVKQALNEFAVKFVLTERTSVDENGKTCYYYCTTNDCTQCVIQDRENIHLQLSDFLTPENRIKDSWIKAITTKVGDSKSLVNEEDYMKLVFYKLTGQNPMSDQKLAETLVKKK